MTCMYRYRQDHSYIPLAECARTLYEIGYREMDVNLCKADCEPIELAMDNWEEWALEFGSELERMGMTVSQSHAPFYRYRTSSNYQLSEYREEMIRRSVIASGLMGVKTVTFHSIMTDETDPKKNAKANLDYFRGYLPLAEKCGVSIAIENMSHLRRKDGGSTYRYLMFLDELLELVDELKKDFGNVGICWDTGHANLMGLDQAESIKLIRGRLLATHIHDNYGVRDDHLLPYLGTINWPDVMLALREIGYEGSFSFEAHQFTARMPDDAVKDALRFSVSVGRSLLGER